MQRLFDPLNKLTKLIGNFTASKRHGKIERYYATDENVELDVWPGGSHWQVTYTQRTNKPTSIPNEDVHSSLSHIVKEKIVSKDLLTWEGILTLLQANSQMSFSNCLIRLTDITLIVMVAVVKPQGFYAVLRQTYDPNIHGTGHTLLTREKDLMNFYYLSGIEKEDVPNPALVDTEHAPEPPVYNQRNTPLIFQLGKLTNELPDKQEDRFWGGRK